MTPDERRAMIADCKVRMAALKRDLAAHSDSIDALGLDVARLAARERAHDAQAALVLESLRVRP